MAWCEYDNPTTMCRESWEDGKLMTHIPMILFFVKRMNPIPNNVRPWKTGELIGDKTALSTEILKQINLDEVKQ